MLLATVVYVDDLRVRALLPVYRCGSSIFPMHSFEINPLRGSKNSRGQRSPFDYCQSGNLEHELQDTLS